MDFKKFSKLILIEQTRFALPFASLGLLFAGGGTVLTWIWVTLALAAARTAGMSFNRIIDAEIDAKNPRTKDRSIPAGELTRRQVWIVAGASSFLLVLASYMLNDLCFYLSFVAVGLLFTYSYFKRFTAASHLYLGFVEAAAPIGGYLAVTGSFTTAAGLDYLPFILGIAILAWIAGLDIVYALLDLEFDKKEGLLSIPVRYGRARALLFSVLLYIASVACLSLAGVVTRRGLAFWVSLICVAVIFAYQQKLARRDDIEVSVKEFFQINAFVSPVLFAGMFMDVFMR